MFANDQLWSIRYVFISSLTRNKNLMDIPTFWHVRGIDMMQTIALVQSESWIIARCSDSFTFIDKYQWHITHYMLKSLYSFIHNKIQTMTSTGEIVDLFLLVQNHDTFCIFLAANTQLYKSLCLSVFNFKFDGSYQRFLKFPKLIF